MNMVINNCVEFCAAFGLTVSEKMTETIHMPEPHTAARTLRTTAVGQEYVSHRVLLYEEALTTTKCESVETSIQRWALLFAGFLVCMDDSRVPKGVTPHRWRMGRRGDRGGRKPCFDGNLELSKLISDWITAARNARAFYDRGEAEKVA